MMVETLDYALISVNAYYEKRGTINQVDVSPDWSLVERQPNEPSSGYEAVAWKRGNEIVIAYTGTDEGQDWATNIPLGFGVWASSQMLQAADFYQKTKQDNPGANITFTGHSLGGGLAALMGVFFNKTAVTFDPAPFRQSASNSNRDRLENYLKLKGWEEDAALKNFYSDVDFTQPENGPLPNLKIREGRVSRISVAGEVLSLAMTQYRIGNSDFMFNHGSEQNYRGLEPSKDLHSIALLAAFRLSDNFKSTTLSLENLIPLIFDRSLYPDSVQDATTNQPVFMDMLVRHEVGVTHPDMSSPVMKDSMLTHFLGDMRDIITAGGLALSDDQLNKGLIALAIQAYYEQDSGFTQELYQPVAGGLQIDKGALDTALDATKSYQQYLQAWLQGQYSTEMDKITAALPNADRVYLATQPGMIAVAEKDKTALMLGGKGSDTLTGGDLADTLIGGQRNDILEGGKGDDTLMGGEGHDHYIWNTGDDNDILWGNEGRDRLEGGTGKDWINGGPDDDRIAANDAQWRKAA
ncbi:MAG: Mbeg1-like protein [Pseudomonadota bacterium]